MLETVLAYLHNWFPVKGGKHAGTFQIVSGELSLDFLLPNQYYRIVGSVFNDGLHRYGTREPLEDETFTGEVWALAVPKAVIELAGEIEKWCAQNPETDLVSESFAGYSYTRAGGDSSVSGWRGVFGARLSPWRKINDD